MGLCIFMCFKLIGRLFVVCGVIVSNGFIIIILDTIDYV